MARTVPPLNPLHVFDAVARLGSLTRASVELCVTHSAVSRQLATLEAYLGVELFERGPRGVALTKVGERYFAEIGPAFAAISGATARLAGSAEGQPLRLCVYTTFAAKWLMHRLNRFEQRYPSIPIEISTTVSPINFSKQDIDAAIQVGTGQWSGMSSEFLFADVIEPVCSPALLANGPPLATIDDLKQHRLLQSRYRRRDWHDWLHAQGRTDLDDYVNQQKGGFQNSLLAYQAAIEGIGIVMGQTQLLANDIAAGRLVCPFQRPMRRDLAYYLLIPEGRMHERKVAALRNWLSGEIGTALAANERDRSSAG
jgi:LysR family glycine cleavage system transcriptional activator